MLNQTVSEVEMVANNSNDNPYFLTNAGGIKDNPKPNRAARRDYLKTLYCLSSPETWAESFERSMGVAAFKDITFETRGLSYEFKKKMS